MIDEESTEITPEQALEALDEVLLVGAFSGITYALLRVMILSRGAHPDGIVDEVRRRQQTGAGNVTAWLLVGDDIQAGRWPDPAEARDTLITQAARDVAEWRDYVQTATPLFDAAAERQNHRDHTYTDGGYLPPGRTTYVFLEHAARQFEPPTHGSDGQR